MPAQQCIQGRADRRNLASAPLIATRSPDPAPTTTKSSRLDGLLPPAAPRSNRHSARHIPYLNSPRVPSLDAFGRRPRCLPALSQWAVVRNPSQNRRSRQRLSTAGPPSTAELLTDSKHLRSVPKTRPNEIFSCLARLAVARARRVGFCPQPRGRTRRWRCG